MTASAPTGSKFARLAILGAAIAAGAVGAVSMKVGESRESIEPTTSASKATRTDQSAPAAAHDLRLVQIVPDSPNAVRLTSDEAAAQIGLKIKDVAASSGPQPLRLPGRLALDPNRLIHVHTRFGGEAVTIGKTDDEHGARPLQYGDRVKRGQLLAVIWSKEIGEKKSELLDANSKLEASRSILTRLESLTDGIVTERAKDEARRDVEADLIAVARAERTLRSWRMTDDEIKTIYDEFAAIKENRREAPDVSRKWAEIEIRAAIDGLIVEKGFNVGDMVDTDDDLFKLADLSRLQVLADIYEEDLGPVRQLPVDARRWTINLVGGAQQGRIVGTFDLIGSVIDPTQRTGVLMGFLNNKDGKLAVGQFITATIELPSDPDIVAIPESALIEDGDSSTVFVEVDRGRREFARRQVTVVRRCADTIYVSGRSLAGKSEGLSVGDRVVVSGSLGLGGELDIQRTSQVGSP